ncbi:MAG: hypothetical protein KKF68_02435, partial [Nanoarchaeota archaeon]|nr:hypothetical protein [Nanoarchaeota archaeon]
IINYGKIAEAKSIFRIGYLFIDITNSTKKIIIDEIQKFDIDIESSWNNNIDGAYADVVIFNNSEKLINFKTSSTSLNPWERKTITGFFDTSNFSEGFYEANITLYYYGRDVGKTTEKTVKIEFVKKSSRILLITVIIGVIILLGFIGIIIKRYFLRNGKKK